MHGFAAGADYLVVVRSSLRAALLARLRLIMDFHSTVHCMKARVSESSSRFGSGGSSGSLGGAGLSNELRPDELWPDELRSDELRREGLLRLARLWICAHIEGDRLELKGTGNKVSIRAGQ